MEYAIAVLDIGKTNKKIVIYNEKLEQVDSIYKSIPTIKYQELDVENVDQINSWFYDNLKIFSEKYNIKSISISTHGATCVCTNREGDLALPVIAYTNDVPDEFHKEFFDLVGDESFLQEECGTAQVKPLINLSKLIYFMKRKFSDRFEKTENILTYSGYFGYKLTGKIAADYTYIGCHTYLWDFKNWKWSNVVNKLGIESLLPKKLNKPGEILGTVSPEMSKLTGLSTDTIVSVGIHDSNSSLIPYLINGEKNFILNSTGTWCVVMHPTQNYSFTSEEIGKTIFYNISAQEELVKTAIFMGGLEFEHYMTQIKKITHRSDYPDFDFNLLQTIVNNNSEYIIPGIMKGAGQFPETRATVIEGNDIIRTDEINSSYYPYFFKNFDYAYGVLNLSLAIQTKVSIDRLSAPKGTPIYIEGGFRKNDVYIKLLASMYKDNPLYTTNIKEATSFGAALIGKSLVEKVSLDELKGYINIEMIKIEPCSIDNLSDYVDSFFNKI